ncbi:ribosome biogenesis protein tsr1 [Coemansia javaensis]|uniref:Ribosome biogenesis protein tsr1 n=1 Tax=Coemansia javaensis TaxID=2761396 RepID=A0A9W8HCC2_9FUNG|nr:ribosome biogenesis protein tsr1 [Coemansia javaensis]
MAKEQQKAFHHRSSLTQKNKPFKRRFATKNSLRDKSKGRTQRAKVRGKVLRKHSRADRLNALRIEQRKKRELLVQSTRIFSGRHRAPKIVAVVPLCADTDTARIVRSLCQSVGAPYPEAAGKTARILDVARFRQTIQFVEVGRNLLDILDAAKVADYMILGLSAEVEVDAFGEHCLAALQNQGHAGVFPVVQGLDAAPAKSRSDLKKSLQSFVGHFFPEADKIYTADSETDSLAILRVLTSQVPRAIKWRQSRPYLLAESVEFAPSAEDPHVGQLALTGYLRGENLSANRLVHIPNFGDFQIERIYSVPVAMEEARGNSIDEDTEPAVIDEPDPARQDSLVEANEPSTFNNEQTWPADDETNEWQRRVEQMDEDERHASGGDGRVLRVPKGTSAYQAAWIVDNDDDDKGSDASEDSDSGSDSAMMGDSSEGEDEDVEDEEGEEGDEYDEIHVDESGKPIENADASGSESGEDDDNMLSPEEEAAQLKAYLKERDRLNRDDMEFPDEVDTPMDVPARTRFARFRGLQSFRTSPWDPYENLPLDYARIFQFENFKRTQQRVLRAALDAPAKAGMHVRIILRAAPAQAAAAFSADRPFVVFGLHQYEHQMSVVHFTVTRSAEYTGPVRSKDSLVIHFGFRRYSACPVFSQHLHGGVTTNNVHKFERFLKPGAISVGTMFAPIQFGSVPVSVYLPSPAEGAGAGGLPTLVGTGTSLEVNPSRILAKRVILTGAPFKIHKRSAVVRYMFFNPEDVNWFKPVQIYTKNRRVGHIMESLGTHGYMKCVFDGQIKQMDTVCMNLYKRVFPKWNTTALWSEHGQSDEQKRQWAAAINGDDDDDDDASMDM